MLRPFARGLSGEGNENGEKTITGLTSKKATLHVQHTFAVKSLLINSDILDLLLIIFSTSHAGMYSPCKTIICLK